MILVAELNPDDTAMANWCQLQGHLHRPFYGTYVHGNRPPQWAIVQCMRTALSEVPPGACVFWVQEPDLFEDPEPLEPGLDLRVTPWGLHVAVSRETRDLFDRTWEDGPIGGGGPLPRLLAVCERLGLNHQDLTATSPPAPAPTPQKAKKPPRPVWTPRSTARRI